MNQTISDMSILTIDGTIIKGIDPDTALQEELSESMKQIRLDMTEIDEILKELNMDIVYDTPNLDEIEENVQITDQIVEEGAETLVLASDENIKTITEYKSLKILGGATTGSLASGGIGLIFGVIPAAIGLGMGAVVGAGLTTGFYYVMDKLKK